MHPKVDILLATHNHGSYVDRAIDGILQQTYPGEMRVIVADDSSTDGTPQKIGLRARERSDIPFEFLPNDGHLGMTGNYRRAFAACEADYVAMIDGDDYWISPDKLAKQIAFLEANPDCVMCGCNYYILDEETKTSSLRVPVTTGFAKYDASSIVMDNVVSNFSTSVYRRTALRSLPAALFELRVACWIVNICSGLQGLLGFLNEPLSVYRVHANGMWSGLSSAQKIEMRIAATHGYDKVTEGRLHKEFENLRTALRASLAATASS